MTNNLSQTFNRARMVSTPLIAIRTSDDGATINAITAGCKDSDSPFLVWDIINGLAGINPPGEAVVTQMCDGKPPAAVTGRPDSAISLCIEKLPTRAIVFMHHFHRCLESTAACQAVWNARESFKQDNRTLVLLGPDFVLPSDLVNDVIVMDDALPDLTQMQEIIFNVYEDMGGTDPAKKLDKAILAKAQDALIGLNGFAAEQVCAMSAVIKKDSKSSNHSCSGFDIESMLERKRQMIEQAPGLSVYRGKEKFADIGGCANIKGFLSKFLSGKETPRLVVWIDEIDKALGGSGDNLDTSGVSQGMLGTMLTFMEDSGSNGVISIGPPGAAKSAIAKATGNEAEVPTVAFDLNGMKASLVGESEANIRQALRVLSAMGQGRLFFVATCNSISSLKPELRRRFTLGTFFYDLPNKAERALIWPLYINLYKLREKVGEIGFDDSNWTGAEIKQCCRLSYLTGITLKEASMFIVPVAIAARESIDKLRTEADGRYVSASYPGVFMAHKSEPLSNKNNGSVTTRRSANALSSLLES